MYASNEDSGESAPESSLLDTAISTMDQDKVAGGIFFRVISIID